MALLHARHGADNHKECEAEVVGPHNRHIVNKVCQGLVILQCGVEILDKATIISECADWSIHIALVEVALHKAVVDALDGIGVVGPRELTASNLVLHRVACSKEVNHLIVDKTAVGVKVFVCRQLLLLGKLNTALGIASNLHNKIHHLEVEVVGLIDRLYKVVLRGLEAVGTRLEMCVKCLSHLNTK